MPLFQSTHPLRGATVRTRRDSLLYGISIHAPLAGCDLDGNGNLLLRSSISIHAPLAGCDAKIRLAKIEFFHFNPRTPCGVRHLRAAVLSPLAHFNPRTPCGVRRFGIFHRYTRSKFQSTHPLRGATRFSILFCRFLQFQSTHPLRGATCLNASSLSLSEFQSTHPLRGATLIFCVNACRSFISIHAPLAGCDGIWQALCSSMKISIHAPLAGCDLNSI